MGGLAGVVHFRGDPPDLEVVSRMSRRLAHRGRHGEGTFHEGPVAMAHRRRALRQTRSVQPLVDDAVVVMMDGWLHGHEQVAARIRSDLPDAPDTHTLLEAWRRWGSELATHLDGSYAAAVWDRKNHILHLFRDRMGIRPLFWAREGSRFAFASELPALLEVPWVRRELAREHLSEYLSFSVVHAPRTLLRDVHQLEPAHWLRVHADELRTRRYWSPRYAPPGTPRPADGEVVTELQEAVQAAVRRRLVRGTPTALYLSGGLGSTAIAAAARRMYADLPTYTIRFTDDPHPEAPFAARVARLLGLEHHEVLVGTPELASAFEAGVDTIGHPVGHPAVFLQLLLARTVGARASLVLSGDGGEELFGGRMLDRALRRLRLAQRVGVLPEPAKLTLEGVLQRLGRGKGLFAPMSRFGLENELGGTHLFRHDEQQAVLHHPSLADAEVRKRVLTPFYASLNTDTINAVLHATLRSSLQEESLTRADRTAASVGLDIRFPLLDKEVFDMAAALPGSSKTRRVGGSLHTRWPLRDMLTGVLPPPLVHRPKRSLPAPLDHWLAGPGRLFLEDRIAKLQRSSTGLWNPQALEDLRRAVGKRPGIGMRLWSLFILDAWIERVGAG